VNGTPVNSVLGAAQGSTLTATVSCTAGRLVGGGGSITTNTSTEFDRVQMLTSRPTSATQWTVIAAVAQNLDSNVMMTVTAYAICA
jgi:hypothetical protein